ncbi:MAG: hypothetical protein WA688_01660 [Thermoplasmata archaeon]
MSESERVRLLRRSFHGAVTLAIGLALVAIGAEAIAFLNAWRLTRPAWPPCRRTS